MEALIDTSLIMHYEDDCFVPPWLDPEPVVLVHGGAESAEAWFAWVPQLAGRLRVLRADLRGHGRSTVPAAGEFEWSLEKLAADLVGLLDGLHLARVHLVGARFGGSICLKAAASHPQLVASVTALGSPLAASELDVDLAAEVSSRGADYVSGLEKRRFGSAASSAELEWWSRLHASTNSEVIMSILKIAARLDLREALPSIEAPLLFVTTDRNPLISVESFARWRRQARDGHLVVLPGDGFHPAATHPQEAAEAVCALIEHASRRARMPGGD